MLVIQITSCEFQCLFSIFGEVTTANGHKGKEPRTKLAKHHQSWRVDSKLRFAKGTSAMKVWRQRRGRRMFQKALVRLSLHIQRRLGASRANSSRISASAGKITFGGGRGSNALMAVAFTMHLHWELNFGYRNAAADGDAAVGFTSFVTPCMDQKMLYSLMLSDTRGRCSGLDGRTPLPYMARSPRGTHRLQSDLTTWTRPTASKPAATTDSGISLADDRGAAG